MDRGANSSDERHKIQGVNSDVRQALAVWDAGTVPLPHPGRTDRACRAPTENHFHLRREFLGEK
jgi:hypothetical protein